MQNALGNISGIVGPVVTGLIIDYLGGFGWAFALAALLAILLGFAVATQVRQTQVLGLESLRQSELVTILDNTTLLSARLDQNARELQATRDELISGSTSGAAALTAAQERLDTLRVLAGTAQAHGPGIRMTINDPGAKVTAPLLLDAIEELRDASGMANAGQHRAAHRERVQALLANQPAAWSAAFNLALSNYRRAASTALQTSFAASQISAPM